jgi:hypothetical protein
VWVGEIFQRFYQNTGIHMKEHYPLMNFRIPLTLKTQFLEICKSRRTQMTSEIVRMITQYTRAEIKEELEFQRITDLVKSRARKKDSSNTSEQKLEIWGSLVKDPVSQTWMSQDEYSNNEGR